MDAVITELRSLEKKALEVIDESGFCSSTIEVSYKTPFRRIEKFCSGLNEPFSTDVLEGYIIHIGRFLQSGRWAKHRYNVDRHAALFLIDCAKIEYPILRQYYNTRYKYLPSEEYVLLAEAATDSIGEISKSYAASTRHYLRQFFCYMEQSGIEGCDQISNACIKDFITSRSDKQSKEIRCIVSALRILLDYLSERDICHTSIDPLLYSPSRKSTLIVPPFSRVEVKAMLDTIDTSTKVGKRNFAIILLAITTGLRGCDIAALKLGDIDWARSEISVTQKKTSSPLVIALVPAVGNALVDYLLNGRPDSIDSHVFLTAKAPRRPFPTKSSFCSMFDRVCASAGVEKIAGRGFHSLRRSAGTWMAQADTPVEIIAQVLGHARIQSSMPYIAFSQATLDVCPLNFTLAPLTRGGAYA